MDLNAEIFGNPLIAWVSAFSVTITINAVVALAKRTVLARHSSYSLNAAISWDGAIVAAINKTNQALILLVTFYIGSRWLSLPVGGDDLLLRLATVGLFLQFGIWLSALLAFFITRTRMKAAQSDPGAATSLVALGFVGSVVVWSAIVLLMLANLGVDVTALIAGLGVGGIAIALAIQNILGDLFASLSIIMDKPFVIGDFIVVDDYMGTVEHVGVKTTRLRSLSGEQVVFSNGDLLKSRLRNYKRMRERRAIFGFGVLYQTETETLKRIPALIQKIIQAQPMTRFDRAHFKGFGDSSLDFEVVYWMLDPDFNKYMDVQQAINLALMEALTAEGVGFAFPSRSLYLETPIQPIQIEITEASNQRIKV
jgi:small-conductance mechanosensitive channel